ncbi:MAG: hypothetical protein IKQ92_00235 [Clostridia bacterium]|nr:hypothetical protein [Clostridia bacterium]
MPQEREIKALPNPPGKRRSSSDLNGSSIRFSDEISRTSENRRTVVFLFSFRFPPFPPSSVSIRPNPAFPGGGTHFAARPGKKMRGAAFHTPLVRKKGIPKRGRNDEFFVNFPIEH